MSACPQCGAPLDPRRSECRYCGTAHGPSAAIGLADFGDQARRGWRAPSGKWSHDPAQRALTLCCAPPDTNRSSLESIAVLDDFELAVSLQLEHGREVIAGVDIRKGERGSYDFRVTGKGVFMVSRYRPGAVADWLVEPRHHDGLDALFEREVRLRIAAKRDRVRCWIGDELIASVADSNLQRGTLVLSAYCDEQAAAVRFASLAIRSLDE